MAVIPRAVLRLVRVQGQAAHERDLLDLAFDDPTVLERPIGEVASPPLATVGIGEPVDVVVDRLDGSSAVLVLDAGHPVGVLTRSDALSFLTSRTGS